MKIVDRLRRLFSKPVAEKESEWNEMKTQPLDAEALARALQGEGRRHVSYGAARVAGQGSQEAVEDGYVLVGNSDGLNVLPDFALFGLAHGPANGQGSRPLASRALASFMRRVLSSAVVHLLDVDGVEGLPLTEAVAAGLRDPDGSLDPVAAQSELQITAGMLFADLLILAHLGQSQAYLISRRRVEHLLGETKREAADSSPAAGGQAARRGHVLSRPAPRDGYLLLSGPALWTQMAEEEVLRTVYEHGDPQAACNALAEHLRGRGMRQEAALVLIHFPPDFDSWR